MDLSTMFALADRQSYHSHTAFPDDIWNAIDKGGLRIYLWIKKELRNYFIKWDTTAIQTVIGQDEYACPPDLATMIRFGERLPGETNYRRIQPVDPRSDLFALKQYEPIVLSWELLVSDFAYIGPYLPRNAGPQAIVCLDANGKYWQLAINDAGLPMSIPLFGSALPPIVPFYLNDPANTTSWQLVVSVAGVFSWSAVGFNPRTYPVSPFTMATVPSNMLTTISVSAAGAWPPGITKPTTDKGPYKVRLAPTPQDLRQTELIYDAKYLRIVNQNSYNVIPDEGHQCQLDFAKAELMRQNSDDLAQQYETLAMEELTEFLTFVRERQSQQPAEQLPYLSDLD
jgi:hypothetical protein